MTGLRLDPVSHKLHSLMVVWNCKSVWTLHEQDSAETNDYLVKPNYWIVGLNDAISFKNISQMVVNLAQWLSATGCQFKCCVCGSNDFCAIVACWLMGSILS